MSDTRRYSRRGRGGGHEQSHRPSLGILVKWAIAQDSFYGVD